jgi:pyrimidine operon attenuation protein / uracil phosphoribosyltransferase
MRVLLDEQAMDEGVRQIAADIITRHGDCSSVLLVGVRRGGVPVANAIADVLREAQGEAPPMGTVDITLYRDDAPTSLPNPKVGPSDIPGRLEGRVVILVDDVCFTGRTVRAAIDVLMDYGRPTRIELAALIDRGGRELPIQPDYSVLHEEVDADERIDVIVHGDGFRAVVQPNSAPSIPPAPRSS